ncbi:42ca947f-2a55-4cb3-ba1e-6a5913b1c6b9-CDS [Sclerotinia trifoliorum]|uniref:42ca947f-2a55-4cb3-ba1e-6a5913b1c6b9-CDS n=1 Tax=Sclerotinia trifoliorum TaxID=28548 RepID=A0A8H2VPH4_9HELO|nr:42ca947f-2a55-4cb3-ba1e-6a5913b1c6b9-CDS [Sclerotinia trifoliorum]
MRCSGYKAQKGRMFFPLWMTDKDLKIILHKVRSYLAELSKSNTLTVTEKQELTTYYGPKWIKCPRHACFYFHEGFSDEPSRDKHLLRHEKPFLCTDLNSAFEGKFPKIKKEPMEYQCDQCSSSFTRSSSLRIHQRTHSNERPFKCISLGCLMAFVRRWDRDEHGRSTHPRMEKASR